MKHLLLGALLASAAFLLNGATTAEEKKKAEAPDEKAMMEAMMKAATPGEHHKKLDAMAGSWDFTVKFWMDPSKPPSEEKGTAEAKWIMEGRYLECHVKGNFGGMPFHGVGTTGYDNTAKKYVSTWIDNMSTAIMYSTGVAGKDGKSFAFEGDESDPLTGKVVRGKSVHKLTGKDSYETAMFKVIGGKDVKQMEITYTRKK